MNLLQMRSEVVNTGFDQNVFGARINGWLNDAQNRIARYVDYYGDESVSTFSTVAGTTTYALPVDWARVRSIFNTALNNELQYVGLRDIDRSIQAQGQPNYYAIDGQMIHLYPTPDNIYPLEMRYWKMPAPLVADTDTPSLPSDYHSLLISYALYRCYERDDDTTTAQYHQQQFKTGLAELATDLRFPTSAEPTQAAGMWDRQRSLGTPGWTAYGGGL